MFEKRKPNGPTVSDLAGGAGREVDKRQTCPHPRATGGLGNRQQTLLKARGQCQADRWPRHGGTLRLPPPAHRMVGYPPTPRLSAPCPPLQSTRNFSLTSQTGETPDTGRSRGQDKQKACSVKSRQPQTHLGHCGVQCHAASVWGKVFLIVQIRIRLALS